MCVIYACYEGLPDDDELRRGASRNDDGAGIMWLDKEKKRVHWLKGLKSDVEVVKKVIEDRKLTFPYVIHFRSASVGGPLPELTHPFPVDKKVPTWLEGTAGILLMHNGHMGNWKNILAPAVLSSLGKMPEGPWSDSRALAYIAAQKGENALELILDGSRVILFDALPNEGEPAENPESYWRMFGTWHRDRKGGYIQSCLTGFSGKAEGVRTYPSAVPTTTHSGTSGGNTTRGLLIDPRDNVSTWSLEELEKLCTELETEQANVRRRLAGN